MAMSFRSFGEFQLLVGAALKGISTALSATDDFFFVIAAPMSPSSAFVSSAFLAQAGQGEIADETRAMPNVREGGAVVPLPATLTLLSGALGGLALVRRRPLRPGSRRDGVTSGQACSA